MEAIKDILETSWTSNAENYLTSCKNPTKKCLTKKFITYLKDNNISLENLELRNIEIFFESTAIKELSTLKSYVKAFIAYMSSFVNMKISAKDMKQLKHIRYNREIKKPIEINDCAFTQEELELILSQINDITKNRDNLIFGILFDTKIKMIDIILLKYRQFDNGILTFNGTKYVLSSKTWEYFNMNTIINPDHENILFKSFCNKPLSYQAFIVRLRKIKDDLGIKGAIVKKLNAYCERNR